MSQLRDVALQAKTMQTAVGIAVGVLVAAGVHATAGPPVIDRSPSKPPMVVVMAVGTESSPTGLVESATSFPTATAVPTAAPTQAPAASPSPSPSPSPRPGTPITAPPATAAPPPTAARTAAPTSAPTQPPSTAPPPPPSPTPTPTDGPPNDHGPHKTPKPPGG